ncbi:hypothetical protein Mgra_00001043 [Meloidogyne graminicola]|uniref:Uncharacterized protein n=1 Tax=Meloidogyne graminicola TaxID=189291 RepID=A0A8T0A1W1_9BILA|nr:hypothetical protein Mgra_00001043 [Meloidogyne graminicola]
MIKLLLFFLFFINFIYNSKEIINNNNCKGCNAYKCMENIANCGNKGYLIAYGEKNCKNFYKPEIFNKFDQVGKKFINCTKDCLINNMKNYIKEKIGNINCEHLKDEGFNSHPKCYLNCNFCKICKTNKYALLKAYDIKDFFSKEAINQVYIVIKECGYFNCFY